MQQRALLVGIDQYPPGPAGIPTLTGCLNDIGAMNRFLIDMAGFRQADIVSLPDGAARVASIRSELTSLCSGLIDGDRVVFHYSGHGAQIQLDDGLLHDTLVPFDFDGHPANAITDRDLAAAFSSIPHGAVLIWIADSCCSGGLTPIEEFLLAVPTEERFRLRSLPMPADIARRIAAGEKLHPFETAAATLPNVVMISACDAQGVAGEAPFENDTTFNGVLTHFLLAGLRNSAARTLPVSVFHQRVQANISLLFPQRSGLHGDRALFGAPLALTDHMPQR